VQPFTEDLLHGSGPARVVLTWPPSALARGRTAATFNLQTQHEGEAGAEPE